MSSSDQKAKGKPMLPALSLLRSTGQGSPSHSKDSSGRNQIFEKSEPAQTPRHRFLSPSEWPVFSHGVGGNKDSEGQVPVRPSGGWWPPKGMPPGLYKDVVIQRTKCFYLFHLASIFRWTLIISQIFIGAAITALGPFSLKNGTPITVLGAVNTVVAGLLALLHNSGLPDRFRNDMLEFEQVEDHIREILEGRLAAADEELDQIMADCFEMFSGAKATVAANTPPTYNSRKSLLPHRRSGMGPLSPAPKASANTASGGEKSFMTSG